MTTRQGESFKKSIQNNWKSVGTIKQEETNHKNLFNKLSNEEKGFKHINQLSKWYKVVILDEARP